MGKSSTSGSRQRKKNLKLIIASVVGIAILGMGAVTAVTLSAAPAQQIAKFGGLASAHDHAAFVIKIDGTYLDFSKSHYQVKSPYIHVENGIGTTLHKHAIRVPFGEFLSSIGMSVTNDCFVMDDGKQYCQSDDERLRFYVNGADRPPSSLMGYILEDNDRILVIYGNETEEQIKAELDRLDAIPIFRS